MLELADQCLPETNLVEILKDPDIKNIAVYFSDFARWTEDEKRELEFYLMLKREMRNRKKK